MRKFEELLLADWPPLTWRGQKVLVAVSGGPDSVALLRALVAVQPQAPARLIVAHFNHRLRGAESDADEAFTADLARRWKLPFECARAEHPQTPPRDEESARGARYAFLAQAAAGAGARLVVTGHTGDDQAETILHRILRGTGLAGLAGMPRARPLLHGVALLRPLLSRRRGEVLEYLAELEQPFREDATNQWDVYTRNRLRGELLPQLAAEYNPQIVEALLRLGGLAEEAQADIQARAEQLLARAMRRLSGPRTELRADILRKAAPLLVREALVCLWKERGWHLQAMTYDRWQELADLVRGGDGPPGKVHRLRLPDGILAELAQDVLSIGYLHPPPGPGGGEEPGLEE